MKTFHLRGRWTVTKFEHFIRAFKLILFDITLLILFIVTLVRIIRTELGW